MEKSSYLCTENLKPIDMKSRIKNAESKASYPRLKVFSHDDGTTVVLFTSKGKGTCVHTTHPNNCLGLTSDAWGEYQFKDFLGTIELFND